MKSGMATLTSKGQLTVPAAIRDALQLKAGDRIEFILDDYGTVRVRAVNKGPEAFLSALGSRQPDPEFAEDDDAIAAHAVERDERSLTGGSAARAEVKAA
jgi:AbrB family looped-hinge helix DNA binding protein